MAYYLLLKAKQISARILWVLKIEVFELAKSSKSEWLNFWNFPIVGMHFQRIHMWIIAISAEITTNFCKCNTTTTLNSIELQQEKGRHLLPTTQDQLLKLNKCSVANFSCLISIIVRHKGFEKNSNSEKI